jgi:hypothetical protein
MNGYEYAKVAGQVDRNAGQWMDARWVSNYMEFREPCCTLLTRWAYRQGAWMNWRKHAHSLWFFAASCSMAGLYRKLNFISRADELSLLGFGTNIIQLPGVVSFSVNLDPSIFCILFRGHCFMFFFSTKLHKADIGVVVWNLVREWEGSAGGGRKGGAGPCGIRLNSKGESHSLPGRAELLLEHCATTVTKNRKSNNINSTFTLLLFLFNSTIPCTRT